MTTDGGGWTLVWSNIRGGKGKPSSSLVWDRAINTTPINKNYPNDDIDSFEVYTGLKHWSGLAPNGQWRYDWKAVTGTAVEQRYKCNYTLTTADYIINFSSCAQLVGATAPDVVSFHSGYKFSAWDKDNDVSASHCGGNYTASPFWYKDCWSGSLWGGGEDLGYSYYPGAYWVSAAQAWATTGSTSGAGNGWYFIK
nr:hypothetical protein BdHM001_23150 [Bdellovibrio sp. HM001]